jgi:hypothetical protein
MFCRVERGTPTAPTRAVRRQDLLLALLPLPWLLLLLLLLLLLPLSPPPLLLPPPPPLPLPSPLPPSPPPPRRLLLALLLALLLFAGEAWGPPRISRLFSPDFAKLNAQRKEGSNLITTGSPLRGHI